MQSHFFLFKTNPALAALPVAHTSCENASCFFRTLRAGHSLQLACIVKCFQQFQTVSVWQLEMRFQLAQFLAALEVFSVKNFV